MLQKKYNCIVKEWHKRNILVLLRMLQKKYNCNVKNVTKEI